ncbi:MAG TPA: hypothetical protein VN419_00730 [Humidesulfovibrio sp.]|uniref:hypothetical protein n=1 Tax=Humidesulfovibrio sp. TaxID=2910988 RepID=UPI002CACBC40|nr:hypothetical protein [Humidesulfovibrio sp.]HWR02513.1 hypothetical protein [Humidesulfovibrio sp.]
MRRTQLAATSALALLMALAAPTQPVWAAPRQPGQAQAAQSSPQQTAQQAEDTALKAASDPEVVGKLKKAVDAQGDISPYTLKALTHDPAALEAVGRPGAAAGGQSAPAPAAKPGAGPKSGKAIYGDIIIHK